MPGHLPSFVIIGAVKAATTWTGDQLRAQPSLYLPMTEPHFFSSEYDRGTDWYRSLFRAAAPGQMVGEKSADYLAHPNAARRMAALLPDARLVVQLRNPIERAYSDYCMLYRRGTVDAGIARLLADGSEQPRFLEGGLYGQHLARFRDLYPADQIQVVLHDDIRRAPIETLRIIGKHIGAPGELVPAAPDVPRNASHAEPLPLPIRRALRPLKGIVAPLREQPLFKALHRRLARPVDYPRLDNDLRARLRDYYAHDVEAVAALLRRDLSHWLALEPRMEGA